MFSAKNRYETVVAKLPPNLAEIHKRQAALANGDVENPLEEMRELDKLIETLEEKEQELLIFVGSLKVLALREQIS